MGQPEASCIIHRLNPSGMQRSSRLINKNSVCAFVQLRYGGCSAGTSVLLNTWMNDGDVGSKSWLFISISVLYDTIDRM